VLAGLYKGKTILERHVAAGAGSGSGGGAATTAGGEIVDILSLIVPTYTKEVADWLRANT
jgi:hypothetical protein